MKFPPPAVIESFPRGLLVPNQRFCRFFRFFPLPSGICRLLRFFPSISAYFQTGLNRSFAISLHFHRFDRPLQPPGLQHEDTTCLAVWSTVWFIAWLHPHLLGQISERFIMLRLADRAMLQERGQQFLLPEIEVTLLLLCSLGFFFRHFALSFTLITGMSL